MLRDAARTAAGLRFLAHATATLSPSLDYDDTLERVARLAVPVLADWCVVDLVEDGALRRVSVAHRDREAAELVRQWSREYPASTQPSRGIAHVIRTGKPELVREIDPSTSHADALQTLGLSSYLLSSYLIVPLSIGDQTLGAITLASASSQRRYDDTDVELASELARRAALAIERARSQAAAREANRERDELIAIVAHDLRDPLGTIGLLASMLHRRHANDADTRELESIGRSVERMKQIIADLLDMSRIEAGKFSLDRRPVSAALLVRDVIASHSAAAAASGIDLRIDDGGVTNACVRCDPARIAQVLGNLVDNAIKFCRRNDLVTVGARLDGRRIRFRVRDTGLGILDEDLPHIFELFWAGKLEAKKGLGLGLFISKRIIEAHGGQIWADSAPGRGTTVYFTLPIADLDVKEPPPAADTLGR